MNKQQFEKTNSMQVRCTLCGKLIAPGAAPGHARRGCEASREPHQRVDEK